MFDYPSHAVQICASSFVRGPDGLWKSHVGRLKKKFEETALLGQKWLKDEEKTVQEVLKDRHMTWGLQTSRPWFGLPHHRYQSLQMFSLTANVPANQEKIAKLGENIVIRRFTRLTLGEAGETGRIHLRGSAHFNRQHQETLTSTDDPNWSNML